MASLFADFLAQQNGNNSMALQWYHSCIVLVKL